MPVSREDVVAWIVAYTQVIAENSQYLTQLDAAIGDADHGANMERGFKAVVSKIPSVADKDIGAIFKAVGMTLVSTVGGAGGPLYGTFFLQAANAAAGKNEAGPRPLDRRTRRRHAGSNRARQSQPRR